MKITDEKNREVTFRDFLSEMGGTGVIYAKDIQGIFLGWKSASYSDVIDYIAPLVAEVIINAAELRPDIYHRIMPAIEEAYHTMRPEIVPVNLKLVKGSKGEEV